MDNIIKISGRIWKAFSTIGIICMFICTFVIILNVILRRFFNMPIYGSTEIVRYVALGTASFSIIENEWSNGNVSMPIFIDALPRKIRDVVVFIGYAICSILFFILDYLLIRQAVNKFVTMSVSQELEFALWIPAAILAIGFFVLTLVLITKTVICGWAVKTGNTIKFEELRTD